ncbi:MAG: 4'-phosphopantetheinyl transferase superfamily protein [Deltaproteobacteria bacterium]|nr:4'-phosphopantetheinyl transferase superfamily protein [Deltaproteobacteria bacterium]
MQNTDDGVFRQPVMECVGNDIVDLRLPQALGRCGDRRFIQRVLNMAEEEAFERMGGGDGLLWAFWAGKEAAYKALSQRYPKAPGMPRNFEVKWQSSLKEKELFGMAATFAEPVFLSASISEEHVHCTGVTGGFGSLSKVRSLVGEWPGLGDDSRRARTLAASLISSIAHIRPEEISIYRPPCPRRSGPPRAFHHGSPLPFIISLSHDGRFASCSAIHKY